MKGEEGAILQALRQAAKVDGDRIPAAWADTKLAAAVAKWRIELNLTPEEIIATAAEVAERLEPDAMGSPAYLNRAMRRAAGRTRQANPS